MKDKRYRLWFMDLKIPQRDKILLLNSGYSAEKFYKLSIKDYMELGFNIIKSQEIEKTKDLVRYDAIIEYIVNEGIDILWYEDDKYPSNLKDIYNPPVALFYKGNFANSDLSIAIVGSRRASEYGRTVAYQISYELGKRGFTIISGLARGIDSSAHKGCLEGGGYTIGVMGSGFKNIYPSENRSLFKDITNRGCVISEYLPDVPPLPMNFPERNRIISGLARNVLVIEAGERSGSLITARLALDQGKDVFAVPGNIYSPNSKGTNKLIKDGAKPILAIDDILEEFDISLKQNWRKGLDKIEDLILNLLEQGAMSVNDILEYSGLEIDVLLPSITKLECNGIIKRAFGNYYIIA